MMSLDELYNNIIEMVFEILEDCEEQTIELINYIFFLMVFNHKLLNSHEVSIRLDTLNDVKKAIVTSLFALDLKIQDAYNSNNREELLMCYIDILEIDNLLLGFNNYFGLLKDYQLCIEKDNLDTFIFNNCSSSVDDYIRVMNSHFNNIENEKENINISLESRIELVRSSMQIVKDNNKYLKKLKK